jgi:6-phosphogluconolactonase
MKNLIFVILLITACNNPNKKDNRPTVFVGTYTQKLGHVDGKATGIYTCKMDTLTGALMVIDSATDIINPSFLTVSPDKKYLYAVAEISGDSSQRLGRVAAYKITEGGKLLKINELSSYGNAPCHISTDKTGKFVFVANYVSGNIVSYGVKADGGLTDSICMIRHDAKSPFAHNIQPSPNNDWIFSVDKGADKIYIYHNLYHDGKLKEISTISTAAGAGPRHLDFNPKNPLQFVAINENSSAMGSYGYDDKALKINFLDSLSTLPADFKSGNSCADVHFHPNGKFVYGSNRGHNSIVIYSFDAVSGKLTLVGHESTQGEIPRNFMISPDGQFLLVANQNSSNVVSFKIDGNSGKLTPLSHSTVFTPVCLKMF